MHREKGKQRGLTLVELMIAMVLAMVFAAAIMSIFTANRASFKQDENLLRMQDDARHALHEISYDLMMAGHYADLLQPASVTPDPGLFGGADCGPTGLPDWIYRTWDAGSGQSLSLSSVDNASASAINSSFSCIASAEFQEGTDVVAIKRVAGGASSPAIAGRVYLRTNGTVGLLYREPTSTPPVVVPVPNADWEYRPRIYYVRSYANTPGDDIPTLCRKTLTNGTSSIQTECIATGIENLQLEFGIDTNGNGDPNLYLSDPTPAQMQDAVSARIFLVARTTDSSIQYDNAKTYSVSNFPAFTPNDGFHRRVLYTTVGLKNLQSLRQFGT